MNICRLVLGVAFVVLQTSDAVARGRCHKVRIAKGRSRLQMKRKMIKYNCKSGYTLVGSRRAICVSGKWNRQPPVCVAPGCPPVLGSWRMRVSQLYDGALLSFSCGEAHALKGRPLIYCNGKIWNAKAPTCIATESESVCDFEEDLCGWTNSDYDQFDWRVGFGKTPTVFTGPSWDHTYGDGLKQGRYLYTEMSTPRQPGDRAQLWSPIFPSTHTGKCFKFWYHMFGRDEVGSLSVFAKPIKESFHGRTPMFVVAGKQGDEWRVKHLKIPLFHEEFQIIFIAERNRSVFSDIAIDDVSVIACPERIQKLVTRSNDATTSASVVTMTSHKDNLPTSKHDISNKKAPITPATKPTMPTMPTTPTTHTMHTTTIVTMYTTKTTNTTNSKYTTHTTVPSFRRTATLSTDNTGTTENELSTRRDSMAATKVMDIMLSSVIWSKEENALTLNLSKSLETTEPLMPMAVGVESKHTNEQDGATVTSTPGRLYEQNTTNKVSDDVTARPAEYVVRRTTALRAANMTNSETTVLEREHIVTDKAQQTVLGKAQSITNMVTKMVSNMVTNMVTLRENTTIAADTVQITDTVRQVPQSSVLETDITPIPIQNTPPATDHSQTVADREQMTDGSPTLRDNSQLTTLNTHPRGEEEQSVKAIERLVGEHTIISEETVFPTHTTTTTTSNTVAITAKDTALLTPGSSTKTHLHTTAGAHRIVTEAQEPDTTNERPATSEHRYETTTIRYITEGSPGIADIVLANNRSPEHVTSGTVQGDIVVPVLRYTHHRETDDVTLLTSVLATAALLSCVVGLVMWIIVGRPEHVHTSIDSTAELQTSN